MSQSVNIQKRKTNKFARFRRQIGLQTMVVPGLMALLIFSYLPMFGIIIAFQNYEVATGFFNSQFVGLKNFQSFLTDPKVYATLRNTISISFLGLMINFPAPIIFAILLNELRNGAFKRITQTISYLPHFISWVIYGGIVIRLLAVDGGLLNMILLNTGLTQSPVYFLNDPGYFYGIMITTSLVKGLGFGSIIYLAAISGVDMEVYEAAIIDGAGRFRRIWHVTLPAIMGTLVIFLIFQISGILNTGFDQVWVLQNALNISRSEVLDTYIYKMGIASMRLSYASAVGLTKSIIALILLVMANYVSNKVTEKGIF
ncbi:MAG: ABC transporter permease subunit [Oscillospiraceae bacterium]|nr:ABC transporter permease subunit [Oscillospiraceae bacterium]